MKRNVLKWAVALSLLLNACKKDDTTTAPPVVAPATGVYVLSEGGFSANNTKLGFRKASSGLFSGDFFLQQNPTITAGLGGVGTDAIIYGGKMYIVMNVSSNVTVVNATDAKFLKQIPFVNGTVDKQPRYAVGTKGKVYVTAYDGTVSVIDTTSLTITNTITVGPNPEGLAVVGNYLYVANSGGFNPVFDSTVSVVDLTTNLEIKKITACLNPQKIEVNSAGDVYVTSYGNYSTIPAKIAVINSSTNTLKTTLGDAFNYDHIRIFNDIAYLYNNYGGAGSKCKLFNTLTNAEVRSEFIADGTAIATVYGLDIDEQNGDVYMSDAKDFSSPGEVTCFDKTGVKKFSFSVAPGVNPNKVIFVR